ncbi:MAG: MFS transporter [Caldimonas sp.]|uniref:Bug family tripartite tricarboxylate transporter substrate binding protein n=1 Tax=Caldimonas taiwanensis TaxID=307483 RepID=UPI0009FEC9D6|nr:tripartite tricarboxylate transporter substrate binding protein [Caldimonas taiwanensis]GIX24287.1 MAG: MFS transporter [Caldimonas sp.]
MLRRTLLRATSLAPLLAPGLSALATLAIAQNYPQRPVRLIVGFPPGTGPDVVARTLGQRLAETLKQTVVVDNVAGAGGQIAAQQVAKGTPDGHTLLLGEVGSISIAPATHRKLPYQPAKELAPVSEIVRADFVLVVPPNAPYADVASLVAAARADKQKFNFATFGAGTPGHFGAEIFASRSGFQIEPVHFRATGDAITALVSGSVQAAFVSTALAAPQIKGGKLRGLATTATRRSALLPEVPTFAELGLADINFSAWFAVFAPAGTPEPVLDQLNRDIVAAVQSPVVRKQLEDAGFTVLGTSRADTQRLLHSEAQRWAAVAKATGFQID